MSITRAAIRQAVGLELQECYVGAVLTATANNIKCTELIDPDESESMWDRAWLKMVDGDAAGDVRRVRVTDVDEGVEGYVPAEGTLQLSRALSSAPAAGDEFELHTLLSPDAIDGLINAGLPQCSYMDEQSITIVADQREYDLSTYTWLTDPAQIVDVLYVYGSTAAKQQHVPYRWFHVERDGTDITLHVEPMGADDDTMYLVALHPYAELATDTASTDCPEQWIKAHAIWGIYNWLTRTGPAEDTERYRIAREEAAGALTLQYRAHMPRPARRIQLREEPPTAYPRGAP